MRPEDWALAKRLLADAAELASAERERYILEQCPDAALAGEIATLTAGRLARLSPDGKWLAYTSNETSADEVYIAPFADATTKTRVSTTGGYEPKWRGDGRELFYLDAAGDLTAVTIRTTPSLEVGAPVRLFRSQMRGDIDSTYAVTRDGHRFLLNMPSPVSVPLTVVVNWLAGRGATR